MRSFALACFLFFPVVALSEGPHRGPEEPSLSSEDLHQAMAEAEREYQQALSKKASPLKKNQKDLSRLVSSLTKNRSKKERTVLEELAREIDQLRNRLVLERATLLSTQTPRKVKLKGATTVFNYRENAVYQVSSAVDYLTDIRLKPGESLTTPPTSGDTVRWNIAVMESGKGENVVTHIILKPTEPDISTNLVITTDEHLYHLAIKSSDVHMPAVSWTYPEDNEKRMREAMLKKRLTEPTVSPQKLRFTYDISGSEYSWKPVRVFDDRKKTFIQMPKDWKTREAPVLFILEDGEDPLLVNYRIEGDFYIVDRLFNKAELVLGKKKRVQIEFDDGKNFFERLFGI